MFFEKPGQHLPAPYGTPEVRIAGSESLKVVSREDIPQLHEKRIRGERAEVAGIVSERGVNAAIAQHTTIQCQHKQKMRLYTNPPEL